MTVPKPRLSLVLPCFNEAENLPALVERCAAVFGARDDVEVVFVDNGSSDGSSDLLARLLTGHRFARSLRVAVNQGYGHGILAGLSAARGDVLGWTHADLQTDPGDALRGLALFDSAADPERLFVKGNRTERPLRDVVFTWGMAAFELVALGARMWDINAQPTLFPRSFFNGWSDPPGDFSLDLYAYHQALSAGFGIGRFPVTFGPRLAGDGHNEALSAKLRYSRRTVGYSLGLRRRLRATPRAERRAGARRAAPRPAPPEPQP